MTGSPRVYCVAPTPARTWSDRSPYGATYLERRRASNLRTGRNCWSSRSGAHSPIRTALTATSTPSTNSDECMASMNAVLLTSASRAPAGPSRRATSNASPSDVEALSTTGFGNPIRLGANVFAYCAANIDPASAMPSAAPISRLASLTAEATPCLSSGAVVMITDVVGAVHNPIPVLITSIGQAACQYGEPTLMLSMQIDPVAISRSPLNTTARRPSRGRYQKDSTDNTSIGPRSGLSASAVLFGL